MNYRRVRMLAAVARAYRNASGECYAEGNDKAAEQLRDFAARIESLMCEAEALLCGAPDERGANHTAGACWLGRLGDPGTGGDEFRPGGDENCDSEDSEAPGALLGYLSKLSHDHRIGPDRKAVNLQLAVDSALKAGARADVAELLLGIDPTQVSPAITTGLAAYFVQIWDRVPAEVAVCREPFLRRLVSALIHCWGWSSDEIAAFKRQMRMVP